MILDAIEYIFSFIRKILSIYVSNRKKIKIDKKNENHDYFDAISAITTLAGHLDGDKDDKEILDSIFYERMYRNLVY